MTDAAAPDSSRRPAGLTREESGAEGQASVELALCLPLLVLVVTALIEIGLLVTDQIRLWHAAREAARAAVVDPSQSHIQEAAERSGLAPIAVAVDPGPTDRSPGEPLTVSLTYSPKGHVPLLGEVLEPSEMQATATMRIEQP
jgi:hypothetical protein